MAFMQVYIIYLCVCVYICVHAYRETYIHAYACIYVYTLQNRDQMSWSAWYKQLWYTWYKQLW